jgi:hypothetical protein
MEEELNTENGVNELNVMKQGRGNENEQDFYTLWCESDIVPFSAEVLHPKEVGYLFGLKEASEDLFYD